MTNHKSPRSRPDPRPRFGRSEAEALAVRALAFLAADEGRMARFFALTGTGPETIRAAAGAPDFLAAVLDHVAANEALLMGFAHAADVGPETIMAAHQLLAPHGPSD